MELGLSLGDASKRFDILENNTLKQQKNKTGIKNGGMGFCMALGINSYAVENKERDKAQKLQVNDEDDDGDDEISEGDGSDEETPVQLNLLPLAPLPLRISSHLPWSSDNGSSENGSSGNMGMAAAKGLDSNRPRRAVAVAVAEEASSANSVGSPFHMDLGIYLSNAKGNLLSGNKRDFGNDVVEAERTSSRASDDDENGVNNRKKLRLSKEQSAFLEESFKENNTLNPKQKLALAKQLSLRPRQVEVWFQNRRARTKLKQTEVDCEYLKRCCETLTEENRRLQKELQELRALKTSNPFYTQLPATTLTMCPSCERVATTTAAAASGKIETTIPKAIPFTANRPRFFPFPQTRSHPSQQAKATNQSFSNI